MLNFSGVTDILDKTLVNLETYYQTKEQQATEIHDEDKENIQEMLEEIQDKFANLQKKTGMKVVKLLQKNITYADSNIQCNSAGIDLALDLERQDFIK